MIEYKQVTKKAPLSFTGNKRNALKTLYECCKSGDIVVGDDTVIVDVFGGSGLLSNFFKQLYPNNTVIYTHIKNKQQNIQQPRRVCWV